MKKNLLLSVALLLISTLSLRAADVTVYYVNSTNWSTVKIYFWTNNNTTTTQWPGKDMELTDQVCSKGAVYQYTLGERYVNVIFNNGSSQTDNLTVAAVRPYYYDGMWYKSIEAIEAENDDDARTVGVPSESSDVMIQGFYWDSYLDNYHSTRPYGGTNWNKLLSQVEDIAPYFSLIWLPPSAESEGGMGYHPKRYSSQNSTFGTKDELIALIDSFHHQSTKVIADIVINHCASISGWCQMAFENFRGYGPMYVPVLTWLCSTDEINTDSDAGDCYGKAAGTPDDGYYGMGNWGGARDWDHTNDTVQAMFKSYLQFLKGAIGYDGWRYDFCLGFHNRHISDYNVASEPYLSVMEYWNDTQKPSSTLAHVKDAKYNTMAFDFTLRDMALVNGIRSKTFAKLKKASAGLRSVGAEKYAVTFVDNHDTFARGANNSTDVGNKNDGSSINNAELILQANAYILSMPGVPCVFYPHWVRYKEPIQAMIRARAIAGVHSESQVTEEEAGAGYYRATIQGKTGSIRLLIGAESGYDVTPVGYICAYADNNVGVYYEGNGIFPREGVSIDVPVTAIEDVYGPKTNNQKVIENGQLLIRVGDKKYNALGQQCF